MYLYKLYAAAWKDLSEPFMYIVAPCMGAAEIYVAQKEGLDNILMIEFVSDAVEVVDQNGTRKT